MPPTLVIMAAGLGSRYGGTKQTDRLGPAGERLLEYSVFDARRAGFGRVVFIIRDALAREFDELCGAMSGVVPCGTAVQDPLRLPRGQRSAPRARPWGTVQAVLAARDAVDEPFAVLNADDFYGREAFARAGQACAARDGALAVIGFPIAETLSRHGPVVRGLCETDGEWLTRLQEVRGVTLRADGMLVAGDGCPIDPAAPASMNFWVFTPAVFDPLEGQLDAFARVHAGDANAELPLPDAIGALVAAGRARVRVHLAPGPWFGLTHAADRADVAHQLRALTDAGEYPSPLWG